MKIGVLTGGGDCPGLNAVIRAVVRKADAFDSRVVGIRNGWKGFVDLAPIDLDITAVTGILHTGCRAPISPSGHGPMGSFGEPLWRESVRAGLVGTDGKVATFSAEIPCRASGRYGYAARVIPRHPDLDNPCIPLLMTWE